MAKIPAWALLSMRLASHSGSIWKILKGVPLFFGRFHDGEDVGHFEELYCVRSQLHGIVVAFLALQATFTSQITRLTRTR